MPCGSEVRDGPILRAILGLNHPAAIPTSYSPSSQAEKLAEVTAAHEAAVKEMSGASPSVEDAAKAYDRAAIFLRGRKGVKTNYPLDTYADDPVLLELESAPRDRFLDILRSGCGASRDTIEKLNKARDHKEAKRKAKQLMRERVEALKRLNNLGVDLNFVDIQIKGDPALQARLRALQLGWVSRRQRCCAPGARACRRLARSPASGRARPAATSPTPSPS